MANKSAKIKTLIEIKIVYYFKRGKYEVENQRISKL